MTELGQVLGRLDKIEAGLATLGKDLAVHAASLRCPEHAAQISELRDKVDDLRKRNSNPGIRSGWGDPKFWTTAIIALGALAAAIAAIVGAK